MISISVLAPCEETADAENGDGYGEPKEAVWGSGVFLIKFFGFGVLGILPYIPYVFVFKN